MNLHIKIETQVWLIKSKCSMLLTDLSIIITVVLIKYNRDQENMSKK